MMSISGVRTLIEMLAYRAGESGEKTAFTFQGESCNFADLWQGINHFATTLIQCGIEPEDRVVITIPNSQEFFLAFYGTQRAGGIAVPIFPGSGLDRVFSLASLCGARLLVVPSGLPQGQISVLLDEARSRGLSVLNTRESVLKTGTFSESICRESGEHSANVDFPVLKPEDIAFIQYTSGSTGNPKGVMLSHDNLLTNVRQMIAGMKISEQDIFVSWLPFYHDMGLILKTMVPFYLAAELHLLPTELRNVRTWLETIQEHRATFTAAPDFAYRLCLRFVNDPEKYDVSSLRVALNAAEPVRANTIEQFESKFGLHNVMVAGYGLAEATVGVSMWEPGTAARLDQRGLVSVGRPFPGVEVIITSDGEPVQPGQTGEIAIRSQANCRGYFNNQEETQNLFWKDGYLWSGDLGYLDEDGFLYIVGRIKNTIKHAGETIAAQEIEEVVDDIPRIRFSAALGIDRGGLEGEQVYVFAEVRGRLQGDTDDIRQEQEKLVLQIVQVFHARLGFRPGRVFLLAPRAIPRTENGKIQHVLLRQQFLSGELRSEGKIVFPDF